MKKTTNISEISKVLNKLKDPNLERSDFMGLLCCVLYSKEIFSNNKDIIPFLNKVFNVSYLQYVIDSRTLIVARLTRYVLQLDDNSINEVKYKFITYLGNLGNEEIKSNKKQNANDKLNTWLKGL